MKYKIILLRCWVWMFLLRNIYRKQINRLLVGDILAEEEHFSWLFNQLDNRTIKAFADKLEYLYRPPGK